MTTLFAELKRRNVIRVAAAYVVVSWLLLQIGDVLFEALKIDDGALSILLAFIVIGFIPVVIFAWVYELTPEGIKREAEIDELSSIAQQTGHKLNIITLVTVVILIALIFWDRNFAPVPRAEPIENADEITQGPSIAVLPFQDMSIEGDQEYFGDGIAEELLNVLAKTKGLRVAARTSSFSFKGNQTDIREIGSALAVKTVLEGSIRKDGDNIRVTAQLINVADGYHIWSESFDRKLNNIFQVQDEIAMSIVDTLKLTLDIETNSHSTISHKAYDLYLRGRNAARTIDKANQLLAIEFFEKAIAIAPNFSEAHAGLASAWIWLEDYGGFSSDKAFKEATTAARKALAIDSTNSEALMAMGLYFAYVQDDYVMARTMFEYALKSNPSLGAIYFHYSDVLSYSGREEEALEFRRRAVELDPLSTFYRSRLVSQLVSLNLIDEANAQLDIIFTQNPRDTHGLEERANLYAHLGEYAKAITDYKVVHEKRSGDPYSASFIALYYEELGLSALADKWLLQSRFRGEDNRWEVRAKAQISMLRGDWQTLQDMGKIQSKTDIDQGLGKIGLAYYYQGEYELARKTFAQVFNATDIAQGELVSQTDTFTLFGQVLLDDLTQQPNQYLTLLQKQVDRAKSKNDYLSYPELNASFVDACLVMMNERLNLEEKNIRATETLSTAIDNGFRQVTMLQQVHCFEPISKTDEFQAVYDRINKLIEIEREKLAEL